MPDVNKTAFDPMKDIWIPNPIDTSSVELPSELDEVVEAAAKAEHEAYVAGRLAEGKQDDLTVPWEDLTEEYRESSRHGVSEAMKVMMVNGYTFEPTAEGTVPMTEEQKNALDNVIAYNAHDVWGAERIAAGWTYGPEKDAEKKTNPTLVPYESLSESETEYDRNFARSTVDNLEKAGLSVVPPVQEQEKAMELPSDSKEWHSLINQTLRAEHPDWDKNTVYKMTGDIAKKMDKLPSDRVNRSYEDKNAERMGKVNLILYTAHPDWTQDQVYEETSKVVKAMRDPVGKQMEDAEKNQSKKAPERSGNAKETPEAPKKSSHNNSDPDL